MRFIFKNKQSQSIPILNSYIFTNTRVPKLSNILTWNSLYHNTPSSPTHIPIKLATPPLKFICQDLITIPTRPPPPPPPFHHRTTKQSSRLWEQRNATNIRTHPPQYLCGKQTWDERGVEWLPVHENGQRWSIATISSSVTPRIILAAIFHPDCRPRLPRFLWFCFFFFFLFKPACNELSWIRWERKRMKRFNVLRDVKFLGDEILEWRFRFNEICKCGWKWIRVKK